MPFLLAIMRRVFGLKYEEGIGKQIGKTMESYDENLFRKNNRIAHPEKIDRYFDLNMEYIGLPAAKVTNAIIVRIVVSVFFTIISP